MTLATPYRAIRVRRATRLNWGLIAALIINAVTWAVALSLLVP